MAPRTACEEEAQMPATRTASIACLHQPGGCLFGRRVASAGSQNGNLRTAASESAPSARHDMMTGSAAALGLQVVAQRGCRCVRICREQSMLDASRPKRRPTQAIGAPARARHGGTAHGDSRQTHTCQSGCPRAGHANVILRNVVVSVSVVVVVNPGGGRAFLATRPCSLVRCRQRRPAFLPLPATRTLDLRPYSRRALRLPATTLCSCAVGEAVEPAWR